MSMSHQGVTRVANPVPKLVVAAVAAAIASNGVQAGETIEFDNGVRMEWNATLGYTAAWRMESPSSKLTGAANPGGDDGNLNFEKHAMINNRVSLLGQANVYKDRTGFFIRGSTFYDDVYHHSNDNPGGTVNKFGAPDQFTSQARKYAGGRSTLLDAYGYTTLDLGNQSLTLRLGRHVVSWGEAYYFSTIAAVQSPTDVAKALVPGTEVKDFVLPVNQLSADLRVTPDWSLSGYAQFESKKSDLPPVGSYLWQSDIMGPGATCLTPVTTFPGIGQVCPFGQRTADEKARSSGQWGIGTRYQLSDVDEIGFFYLNYHDRGGVPVFTMTDLGVFGGIPAATYRVKYFEDIKLTGLTYSTRVGTWQVSAEASYKDGLPVLVDTGSFTTPARAKATQMTVSGVKQFGANPISDGATLVAELSGRRIHGIKGATLEATGTAAAETAFLDGISGGALCPDLGTCGSYNKLNANVSKNHLAYALNLTLNYRGIFPGWDLDVPISFQHAVDGASGGGLAGLYGKGDKRLNVGANFKYLGNLEVNVAYVAFLGSAEASGSQAKSLADRDYISATLRYTF